MTLSLAINKDCPTIQDKAYEFLYSSFGSDFITYKNAQYRIATMMHLNKMEIRAVIRLLHEEDRVELGRRGLVLKGAVDNE